MDFVTEPLCHCKAAVPSPLFLGCRTSRREDQAVKPEAFIVGLYQKLSSFSIIQGIFHRSLRDQTNVSLPQKLSENIKHRGCLPRTGIEITVSVSHQHSATLKKAYRIPRRKFIKKTAELFRIIAVILPGIKGKISQIAFSVPGNQQLFSHSVIFLKNRHLRSVISGCHRRHHAGGPGSNNSDLQGCSPLISPGLLSRAHQLE